MICFAFTHSAVSYYYSPVFDGRHPMRSSSLKQTNCNPIIIELDEKKKENSSRECICFAFSSSSLEIMFRSLTLVILNRKLDSNHRRSVNITLTICATRMWGINNNLIKRKLNFN